MAESFQMLTNYVEGMLTNLNYSINTISKYQCHWKRIAAYMENHNIKDFNRNVAESYFYDIYDFSLQEIPSPVPRELRQCRRTIEVLLEYQHNGTIYRRRRSKSHIIQECYQPIFDDFMGRIHKTHARTTYRQFRSRIENFLNYLYDHDCKDLSLITKQMILNFWKTREPLSKTTLEYDCYLLRKFLDYLYENGHTLVDHSVFVPNIKEKRKGRLPSYYTTDEITKLLSNVDRSNPTENRNYAILHDAHHYGRTCAGGIDRHVE